MRSKWANSLKVNLITSLLTSNSTAETSHQTDHTLKFFSLFKSNWGALIVNPRMIVYNIFRMWGNYLNLRRVFRGSRSWFNSLGKLFTTVNYTWKNNTSSTIKFQLFSFTSTSMISSVSSNRNIGSCIRKSKFKGKNMKRKSP